MDTNFWTIQYVASELKDPIWHSLEWQIGSFSSEETNMFNAFKMALELGTQRKYFTAINVIPTLEMRRLSKVRT